MFFVFVLLFLSSTFAAKDKNVLDFIVIGDWGGLPYPPYSTDIEKNLSRNLMNLANIINVDFLLALGDNFYYNGVENEYDSRFNNSFENVFTATDLFFPWYFIAGNHDWHGNVSAQIAYTKHSKRWNFPNYFYTIEQSLPGATDKKIAILMIDTVLLCGLTSSDFEEEYIYTYVINSSETSNYWKYIKNELVRVQNYTYVIVAGHYPVWSMAEHGPNECLIKQLDPLLKQFNVTAYINGHDHTLEHIQVPYESRNNMNYFTIGAANFYSNSEKHKNSVPKNSLKFHWKNLRALGGFAFIRVTTESLAVEFLSTEGDSLYFIKLYPRN